MSEKKKKESGFSTVPATTILILIAIVLVLLGYIYLAIFGDYSVKDLVQEIVGNLIGVLVAFLLFDIIYNKLTKDAQAKEISDQITKTLIGNPEMLDAFSDEDKMRFLTASVDSIVKDEDASDMVVKGISVLFPGDNLRRIRKSFVYDISVSTEFPNSFIKFLGNRIDNYMYVKERLDFDVKYLGDNDNLPCTHDNRVKIGFSFDKRSLDSALMENGIDHDFDECIFNENLDIDKTEANYIKTLSGIELNRFYEDIFSAVLKIDDDSCSLDKVDVRPSGIIATYRVSIDNNAKEHSIRVIFNMPKLWNSVFEVTLVDPTKGPKIKFDYMPDRADVTMYSYLNKESKTNEGAYEQRNGMFLIDTNGEWIYPKSGVTFFVKKKEEKKAPLDEQIRDPKENDLLRE